MRKELLFVVSDSFDGFASNEDVISYSELIRTIETGTISARRIIIGQGMDEVRRRAIKRALTATGLDEVVKLIDVYSKPVDRLLVHKHKPENVCIDEPRVIGEGRFTSRLVLDDRCADMSDHSTGQHIQGTVLIEASRQMMMAGVEMYAFQPPDRGTYQYTLNDFAITFRQFVFPLAVDIDLCVLKRQMDKRGVMSLELTVNFSQLQTRVCDAHCVANGYPGDWIKRMEARQAQRAVTIAKSQMLQAQFPQDGPRPAFLETPSLTTAVMDTERAG